MSAYDRVLDALEQHVQVLRRGDQSRAQCPVHGSRGLTLSVRRGDGRATVHCFANCEDVSILDAIGLKIGDLFDEPRRQEQEYVPLRRPTFDLGAAGVWDRETLANHLADRSAQQELLDTLGPDLLALADVDAMASLYLGGRHGECD